jgi:hypothetical protein
VFLVLVAEAHTPSKQHLKSTTQKKNYFYNIEHCIKGWCCRKVDIFLSCLVYNSFPDIKKEDFKWKDDIEPI